MLTLDQIIRRIADRRGCTLACAAELLRADPELVDQFAREADPPQIVRAEDLHPQSP